MSTHWPQSDHSDHPPWTGGGERGSEEGRREMREDGCDRERERGGEVTVDLREGGEREGAGDSE